MGRRDDNKRRKREAIERAGLDAFRARGYEGASIEQIAREAGVARGTFYLYFPDKLSLFEALMDRWAVAIGATLDALEAQIRQVQSPEALLAVYRGMAMALAMGLLGHLDVVELAFRESRQPGEAGRSLRQRELAILDRVTAFTALAADRGLIRVSEPRLVSLVIFGAVERLFYEVRLGTELGEPVQVVDEVLALFAAALGLSSGLGPSDRG